MSALIFGSQEAAELVAKAKEMGMALVPDDAAIANIAERVWDMVEDTYIDNIDGNKWQSAWHKDMIKGIVGILKGWRP